MTVRRKPYKFTVKKQEKFLQLVSEGSRRGIAAESVGVTRQCVSYLAGHNEEFAKALELAEMDANEQVEDALFQAATSGNVVAIQVWLYNRSPQEWADRRRVEGKVEGKVLHAHIHSVGPFSNASSDELVDALELLSGLAAKENVVDVKVIEVDKS